jgi:hypothetical protein
MRSYMRAQTAAGVSGMGDRVDLVFDRRSVRSDILPSRITYATPWKA